MNYKKVVFYLGQILKIMSAFMLLPVITGLCYGEFSHIHPFLITAAIYFLSGFLITRFLRPADSALKNKEGLAIVGLSWIVISAIGALPFVIDGCIPNYIDAFFETVSGFTTTGSQYTYGYFFPSQMYVILAQFHSLARRNGNTRFYSRGYAGYGREHLSAV